MGSHCRQYAARRRGEQETGSILPIIDYVLATTYGAILYEEQLLEMLHLVSGLAHAGGLRLLSDIGSKDWEALACWEKEFVTRAAGKGISQTRAASVFRLVKVAYPRADVRGRAMIEAARLYGSAYRAVHGHRSCEWRSSS